MVATNEELVISRETSRFLLIQPPSSNASHALPRSLRSQSRAYIVALGLVRALDNRGVRVAFCKPIGQPTAHTTGPECSTHFVRATTSLRPALPLSLDEAERLISSIGPTS